jgi:hypothetical protein
MPLLGGVGEDHEACFGHDEALALQGLLTPEDREQHWLAGRSVGNALLLPGRDCREGPLRGWSLCAEDGLYQLLHWPRNG